MNVSAEVEALLLGSARQDKVPVEGDTCTLARASPGGAATAARNSAANNSEL